MEGPEAEDCKANGENPLTIPEGTEYLSTWARITDVNRGNSNIFTAEYFIGTPGANGTGIRMIAMDLRFDSPDEYALGYVDSSRWTSFGSPYLIHIHGMDDANNWGDFCTVTVHVGIASPTPTPTKQIPVISSQNTTWFIMALFVLMITSALVRQLK